MIQKYLNIIASYKRRRIAEPDTWLEYCKSLSELNSAIRYSALSINALGKRHPHQYRLKKLVLQQFSECLLSKLSTIEKVSTFDDLYRAVCSCQVEGIGQLTVYDTSQRIGEYLDLKPNYIYLHAGTRVGAEKLIGRISGHKIDKQQLPEPFRSSDLSPAELEDILCIYKERLGQTFNRNKI